MSKVIERRKISEKDIFTVLSVDYPYQPKSSTFDLIMVANLKGIDHQLGDRGEFPIKLGTWMDTKHRWDDKIFSGIRQLGIVKEFLENASSKGYEVAMLIKKPLNGDSFSIKDFKADLFYSPHFGVIETYCERNGVNNLWRADLNELRPSAQTGRALHVDIRWVPQTLNDISRDYSLIMIEIRQDPAQSHTTSSLPDPFKAIPR